MDPIRKLTFEEAAERLNRVARELREFAPAVSMRASALARELELKIGVGR